MVGIILNCRTLLVISVVFLINLTPSEEVALGRHTHENPTPQTPPIGVAVALIWFTPQDSAAVFGIVIGPAAKVCTSVIRAALRREP